MRYKKIQTLGDLKNSGYIDRSIKQEMRDNLIQILQKKRSFAPFILGYEETVFPQLHQAILAQHDFILLGLRGQGKSRILKSLVFLLDEYIPILKESPIYESPFFPILKKSKKHVEDYNDKTPIRWLHYTERFSEKLATPDVTIADLIGDIDPIKAAQENLNLSEPDIIDFGLVPKANRCIFAINEFADLQARIQVGLFNIMEEKNIQIKGFPIQFHLDILLVYTSNPEDYTTRGSIVTPIKDRIDSQIITHYPHSRTIGIQIAKQECASHLKAYFSKIPNFIFHLIEQIVVEARKSSLIDQSSGVSARLSISTLEHTIVSSEKRMYQNNEAFMVRISDVYNTLPAITGKIELLYEGEEEGSIVVAEGLIAQAILTLFGELFGNPEKEIEQIRLWFEKNKLEINHDATNETYKKVFSSIPNLDILINKLENQTYTFYKPILKHLIIEGMVMKNYLSKFTTKNQTSYKDMMSTLLS